MKLAELLINSKTAHTVTGNTDIDISDITFDSRKASEGVMFFCHVGSAGDGHDYAKSAYEKGCRVFAISKDIELPQDAVKVHFENMYGFWNILPHDTAEKTQRTS